MKKIDYLKVNKASYRQIAEEYYNSHLESKLPYLDEVMQLLPEGLEMLDIGCGPGNLVNLLQSRKPKHLICIDNSPEMLVLAKKHYSAPNVEFVEADYLNYFPDYKFDYIQAHLSFVHLPPEKLPEMIAKVLSMAKTNFRFFANYFIGNKNEFKPIHVDYGSGNTTDQRYFGIYNSNYIKKVYKAAGLKIIKQNIFKGSHFDRFNLLAVKDFDRTESQ